MKIWGLAVTAATLSVAGVCPDGAGAALTIGSDVSVEEKTANGVPWQLSLTIRDDAAPTFRRCVKVSTVAGTATAPDDYTALSGGLCLEPGVTSITVRVQIWADSQAEPDERFSVQLSEAQVQPPGPWSPYPIADDRAEVTLRNDDKQQQSTGGNCYPSRPAAAT